MKNILRSRVAAVSVGALVVVGLGSTAGYAAGQIGSQDIRNQSVRGIDIAPGAIDNSELRNRGVNGPDLGLNTIGRPQIRPNSVGVNQIAPFVMGKINEHGQDGTPGKDGENGVSGYEIETYDYIAGKESTPDDPGMGADYQGAGSGGIATVACSSEDKVAVGGGYRFLSDNALTEGWTAVESFPGRMDWTTNTPKPGRMDGWIVRLNAPQGASPIDMEMYAICATIAD